MLGRQPPSWFAARLLRLDRTSRVLFIFLDPHEQHLKVAKNRQRKTTRSRKMMSERKNTLKQGMHVQAATIRPIVTDIISSTIMF